MRRTSGSYPLDPAFHNELLERLLWDSQNPISPFEATLRTSKVDYSTAVLKLRMIVSGETFRIAAASAGVITLCDQLYGLWRHSDYRIKKAYCDVARPNFYDLAKVPIGQLAG